MDFQEKKLYHQIHPLKLFTDWVTGVVALYLLWVHQFILAILIMFLPSIIITFVLIKYVNLEWIKESSVGNYIRGSMTRGMEVIRFIGFGMMIVGAWYQIIWLMVCGLIVILFGWLRGIILA